MLNLLPGNAQKVLANQYRGRLGMLWLIVLLITFLISAASLLPALIDVSAREEALKGETEFLKAAIDRYRKEAPNLVVDQAAEVFKASTFDRSEYDFSSVLREILKYDSSSVDISRFNFTQSEGGFSAEIEGLATKRDDLVFLLDALKRDPMFKDASVPISAFAKDRDLSFTVTIVGNSKASEEQ
jgi:hypothetical protein